MEVCILRNNLTANVFGVKNDLIASYIEREQVDEKFRNAVAGGNEVIVYGSSKQGKTSLLLRNLHRDDYIKVECTPNTAPEDIYKSALRQLKVKFTESITQNDSYEHGGKLSGSIKIKIPFIGGGDVNAEAMDSKTSGESKQVTHIEYNLALAQDVSELLREYAEGKFIVLENFHYLSHEAQKTLSYDLRVFQDQQITFIILGIWREANRLVQFNGDLLDRISEVPVEPWSKDDIRDVIKKGERLLNVDFSWVLEMLIDASFDSIGVVQEICKLCCLEAGVKETAQKKINITVPLLKLAIDNKTQEYGVRHIRNLEAFADVPRKTSNQSGKPSLAIPYYFVLLLLENDFEDIERGIHRTTIHDEIRKIHHRPEDVRSGDLSNFLHNITQHQISKDINPPFVDYDRNSKRLRVIDSSLYFFLRNCDREVIIRDIPNPIEETVTKVSVPKFKPAKKHNIEEIQKSFDFDRKNKKFGSE